MIKKTNLVQGRDVVTLEGTQGTVHRLTQRGIARLGAGNPEKTAGDWAHEAVYIDVEDEHKLEEGRNAGRRR